MCTAHSCFVLSEGIKTQVAACPQNNISAQLRCLNHTESLHSFWKWSTKAQKHGYITQDKRRVRKSERVGENKQKALEHKDKAKKET